jgi:hypothetical protein
MTILDKLSACPSPSLRSGEGQLPDTRHGRKTAPRFSRLMIRVQIWSEAIDAPGSPKRMAPPSGLSRQRYLGSLIIIVSLYFDLNMSSRRSSTSHDGAGPSKKQKVYRACLACVNSKTRCEDVEPRDGCLRCRTKNKTCSLVQREAVRSASRSRAPDDEEYSRTVAMEEGWNLLHQRLDRLEQNVYSRPPLPPTTSTSNIVTPAATPRPVDIHKIFTTLNWHSIPMTERIFTVASDLGYPDPVARGLLSAEQMEMAFHL